MNTVKPGFTDMTPASPQKVAKKCARRKANAYGGLESVRGAWAGAARWRQALEDLAHQFSGRRLAGLMQVIGWLNRYWAGPH